MVDGVTGRSRMLFDAARRWSESQWLQAIGSVSKFGFRFIPLLGSMLMNKANNIVTMIVSNSHDKDEEIKARTRIMSK